MTKRLDPTRIALLSQLTYDVTSVLTQAEGMLMYDNRARLSETELVAALRGGARANLSPVSGREWRMPKRDRWRVLDLLEDAGFQVTHVLVGGEELTRREYRSRKLAWKVTAPVNATYISM